MTDGNPIIIRSRGITAGGKGVTVSRRRHGEQDDRRGGERERVKGACVGRWTDREVKGACVGRWTGRGVEDASVVVARWNREREYDSWKRIWLG